MKHEEGKEELARPLRRFTVGKSSGRGRKSNCTWGTMIARRTVVSKTTEMRSWWEGRESSRLKYVSPATMAIAT